MTKVFISSTSEDPSEYRTAAVSVCNELGYMPNPMQFLGPIGRGATSGSDERLKQANLYLGIFPHRYGYIEEGYNCRVTEAEFDYAHECGIERDPKRPVCNQNFLICPLQVFQVPIGGFHKPGNWHSGGKVGE